MAVNALAENQDQGQRARLLAQGLWDTEVAAMVKDLPRSAVLREQGFRLYLQGEAGAPDLEVIGEIDLLLIRPEGLCLVDYKVSGRIEPEKYRDQLCLYSLALWRGQPDQGPPPQAYLCYLQEGGAELVQVNISPEDLRHCQGRLEQAARDISRLPLQSRLDDLERGEHCNPDCILARQGLCTPGKEA
jgi:ATP-dependent helicase/nuclease subunit A